MVSLRLKYPQGRKKNNHGLFSVWVSMVKIQSTYNSQEIWRKKRKHAFGEKQFCMIFFLFLSKRHKSEGRMVVKYIVKKI
jgi:hypothetical protein